MKPRLSIVMIVVVGLLAAIGPAAAAQAPSGGDRSGSPPAFAPELSGPNAEPEPSFDPEGSRPWGKPEAGTFAQVAAEPSAIPTGQPGLSFRYAQTIGIAETPYIEDTIHVNNPGGLAVNNGNLWLAECDGRRLLKYTTDGTFLTQIGKGGFAYTHDTTIWCPNDVAVDTSGNIWYADGTNHVVQFDATGKKLQDWGAVWDSGSTNDRFSNPHSIAFDATGNVYISDRDNHRIQVFDGAGKYLHTIGQTGVCSTANDKLCSPQRIEMVGGNRLYVADTGNHRIQIFDVSNIDAIGYVATIGTSGASGSDNAHFDNPTGVAVDPAHNRIFVADAYNWRVQVFSYSSRAYQQSITGFSYLSDVAVDQEGRLYTAEPWSDRHVVRQFNVDLTPRRTYGVDGVPYVADAGHVNQPSGMALLKDGSLVIGEQVGRRLLVLNPDLTLKWQIGEPPGRWGSDNAHFTGINDVAVDAQGRIYATDESNCRVQVFRSDGEYLATIGGSCGTSNSQLNRPFGVAVAPNGDIYVADRGNHRVQVFNSNREYVATLGQTGVATSSNAGFNEPMDVAVDSAGQIYVSELSNRRVQIFDRNRIYIRTLGVTGESGSDHGHFNGLHHLAVDAQDRLYVADAWNNRVQVYDREGGYLTTIGGGWGTRTGQLRSPHGIAVAPDGSIYVADWDNHRIQKFAPGVPGWRQVNINGWGDRSNSDITALMPFSGQLYAGTGWNSGGAQLWRLAANGAWTTATTNGFGDPTNQTIYDLVPFNGHLYAGTYNWDNAARKTHGAQMWRSVDGTAWEQVVSSGFGDPTNGDIFRMAVFDNRIYGVTDSFTNTHSSEIWRSTTGDAGSWGRVVENAFGDSDNWISAFEAGATHLYAGTWNDADGAQVWRSADGVSWARVNVNGFGTTNTGIISFAEFRGQLYAGTRNWTTGAQIWRCTTCDAPGNWSRVMGDGFGDKNNGHVRDLYVQGDQLYAATYNEATGLEVWRTSDGMNWTKVGSAGFGDSNNRGAHFDRALAAFNGRLYVGTQNYPNGAEIWVKTLTADFTATPTRGAPPLTVQFTNTSAGDFTSSQWDFGDGGTSTEVNPMHTYTAAGTYAVTLTIGDGTDTSTITKPGYIVAKHFTYLPVVMRNYRDPYLYDDFDDPAYDGTWNPQLWSWTGAEPFHAAQRDGAMVFWNTIPAPADGPWFRIPRQIQRSPQRTWFVEGRMRLGSDRSGGWSSIQLKAHAFVNGHGWTTLCSLGASQGRTDVAVGCGILGEYETDEVAVPYDTWHVLRIEMAPTTAEMRFYLDGTLIGTHVPLDASALAATTGLSVDFNLWHGDPDSASTRYVDWVRITPAQ